MKTPNRLRNITRVPVGAGSWLAYAAVVVAQSAFEGMATSDARVQDVK